MEPYAASPQLSSPQPPPAALSGDRAAVGAPPLRVVVVSRAGCHLCGPVEELVERVCGSEVGWAVTDVDADPELRERYGDLVPVTLVDGALVARWSLTEQALRSALERGPGLR